MATYGSKPLLRRERVRDQIARQRRIRKRIELNEARAQFRNAGIFYVAVNQHHAFLADIRIETAESNGEIGILVKPDADKPVEDGIAILKRDLELLIAPGVPDPSAPDFQMRRLHARAACAICSASVAKLETSFPLSSQTRWLISYSARVCGKSLLCCAPRLSGRLSALSASASA